MSASNLSKFLKQDILENIIKKDILEFRGELNKMVNMIYFTPEILQKNTGYDYETSLKIFHLFSRNVRKNQRPLNTKPSKRVLVRYLQHGKSMLLVGPSYDSVQRRFSLSLKTPEILDLIKDKRYDDKGIEINPFDVGHTGSFNTEDLNSPLSRKLERARSIIDATYNDGTLSDVSKEISKLLKEVKTAHIEFDALSEKDLSILGKLKGKFTFIFTIPQLARINNLLSQKENDLTNKIQRYLDQKVLDLNTSKSFFKMITDFVTKIFHAKEAKAYHSKTKTSAKKKIGANVRIKKPNIQVRDTKGKFASLINIQALMNVRLHDQIRKNMGTGQSSEILNYRTGRFARSANISSLQQRQEKIVAFYTYMRNPYDVFLPGGRLHKPGRDPRRIIGRSIRELAVQLISDRFKVYPELGVSNQ